jgi:hypothetical protein
MVSEPILVIKDTPSTIGIRARVGEVYKENNIQLSVMLGYYWDNNLPVIKNLIELFENVIKRTINEVYPHQNLFLKYDIITDDILEKATMLEIKLIEVKADGTNFRLDGKIISLKGILSKETYTAENKDEITLNKHEKHVEKTLVSKEKISFKEFIKLQQK